MLDRFIDAAADAIGYPNPDKMLATIVGIALGSLIFQFGLSPLINRLERRIRASPQPAGADPTPEEVKRRSAYENERIKLTATLANNCAVAVLLSVVILPIFRAFSSHPEPVSAAQTLSGMALAFVLHVSALWMLRLWR